MSAEAPTLGDLLADLADLPPSKVEKFSIVLGVPKNVVDESQINHPKDIYRVKSDALDWWIRNYNASWEAVAKALETKGVDERNLAKRIRSSHGLVPAKSDGQVRQVTQQNTTVTHTSEHTLTHRIPTTRSNVVSDDGRVSPITSQPSSNGSKSMWCKWQWILVLVVGVLVIGAVVTVWTQHTTPVAPLLGGAKNEEKYYEALDLMGDVFDERPKMTELRHLELPKPMKAFDVAEMIGLSYVKVGGELLEDFNGKMVDIIYANNFHKVTDTNADILKTWLQGGGKQPVNWRTLIQVLERRGEIELAWDIRKALLYKRHDNV